MRSSTRWLLAQLCCAIAVLAAATAQAAPITYGITTGTITVQANQSSDQALIFNQTLNLSLTSFVTWDPTGTPQTGVPGSLDDFLFDIVGPAGPYALEPGQTYGPFDMITIETAEISPDTVLGYDTLLTFPSGPGFLIQAGNIAIDAFYSASNSTTGATTPGPIAADIQNINNMNGNINFNSGIIQVVMDSIVMGTVDGTPFGEAGNDLILTANINFFGDANVVPAPEPSTGLMLTLGIVGLSLRRRAGRPRR